MANNDYITIHTKEWHNLLGMVMEIRSMVTMLIDDATKELMTPTEVCKQLKISRSSYQRLVADKVFEQIRISKKSNCRVFIKRSELNRLIEEGKL